MARLRLAATCFALTALAFLQEPGRIVADTKIDLVVNPVGFLQRTLHLWDPSGSFGQLQNQAYGYLWPMGPFFAAGWALGVPAWVIQRLWWATLMCVACAGLVRLATRLGIGTPGSRLVAGVAFALSPRILTLLGANSVEAWPMAVAPWVLVPLIGLARGGRLRPAVTRSAIAVACAGGVNGTAVLAILPPALIWLAMLRPRRRRLVALGAWGAAVACAAFWWVGPLLILGRYSPPILDYTETAAVTTQPTDAVTILRGASNWLGFYRTPFGAWWPAGGRLATESVLIVATMAVAAFGLAGLARRGIPHRRFLVGCLLAGLALVGFGHVSALWGTFGSWEREFFNGVGAPLRNVHKFDIVLRLPLALGLAHLFGLATRLAARVPGRLQPTRGPAVIVAAAMVAAIAATAAPALAGGLGATGSFTAVPGYWYQAADWLNAHAGRNRVLILPSVQFPSYQWGSTGDEMTQPLLNVDWAVRNVLPMAPAGTIRLMDAIETAISTGAGSTGLADLLARSGVEYVLLRSDLDYGRSAATRPLVARQALDRSPGLSLVAGFGPQVGGDHPPQVFFDRGLNVATRALEVFRVDAGVSPVVAFDANDMTTVVGGPESLMDLSASGVLSPAPVVLAGDLPGRLALGTEAITDGLRRREVAFGLLHDNISQTFGSDDRFALPAPAHDYLPTSATGRLTTARYDGITAVTASTAWSQAGLLFGTRPEHQPFAALDGNPATSWRPAPGTPNEGQWIEVGLAKPQRLSQVRLHFDLAAAALPTKVTVTAGSEESTVDGFGADLVVPLPGVHATRTVRVTVDQLVDIGGRLGSFGISELQLPGVDPSRTLVVPPGPDTAVPATLVFSAAPSTPACFFVDALVRCAQSAARGSEDAGTMDRTVTLPSAGTYLPSVWMRPKPGDQLDALLDDQVAANNPLGLAPRVTASSTGVADPAGRPGVVVDGDPETVWTADSTDKSPLLHLAFYTRRVVTGLRITLPEQAAAARPGAIRAIGDDGEMFGFLDPNGEIIFPRRITTNDLTILLYGPALTQSYDPYGNFAEPLAIGVGEVTALPDLPNPPVDLNAPVRRPCGSGPDLRIGDVTVQTRISATRRDLLELRETPAELCVTNAQRRQFLSAGELRVVATSSDLAVPTRVALVADQAVRSPTATPVRLEQWSATQRRVHLDPRDAARVLAMRDNTNPGWQAIVDGRVLTPIVLDGWEQGWLVPAGVGGDIEIRFGPDTTYRAMLLVGAVLLGCVLVLGAIPNRRRGVHTSGAAVRMRTDAGGRAFLAVGAVALVLAGGAVGLVVVLVGIIAAHLTVRGAVERSRRRRGLRMLDGWFAVGLFSLGGWLTWTVSDSHIAGWPQLAGLLAVGVLWLSAATSPAAQTKQRPLQQIVAGGGKDKRDADGP